MGLTKEGIMRASSRIALLPFFPASDTNARAVLMEEILLICESDEHAHWLALRMTQIFKSKWPGLAEMRALYCKRFRPRDGVQADSECFPDGFPTEQELGVLNIPGLPAPIPQREFISKREEQRLKSSDAKQILAGVMESTEFPK